MKTVGEFKKAGLQFVGNDMPDGIMKVSSIGAASLNANDCFDGMWVVGEFAWSENTGVKPEFSGAIDAIIRVGDNVEQFNSVISVDIFSWSLVIKWRPSLNQPSVAELDNKQSAIHKAWVDLKGDLSNANKYDSKPHYLIFCIKDTVISKSGKYLLTEYVTNNDEYWRNVCTIQEFTDYCEKMAAEEKRMDIIGQNGNDGLHYDNTAQQVEALAMKQPSEKMKVALKEADDISGGFITRCLVFKPADKPIFTQAMADAGELPPVGSLVDVVGKNGSELAYGEGEKNCEVLAHIEDTAVIRMSFGLGCFSSNVLKASDTRTDREKAIDTAITVAHQDGQDYQYLKGSIEKLYDAGLLKC